MKAEKLKVYYQTLRHVKITQLYHQVYYRMKSRLGKGKYIQLPKQVQLILLDKNFPCQSSSFRGKGKFVFLNLEKSFDRIDWNFSQYGKLWTYNLNYFEFLHQEEMTKEEGQNLIKDYITFGDAQKEGLEPYPISLRGINWIKFLAKNKIQDEKINNFLFKDYLRLADNLEYHLLANHLLENSFSLLFGAYYFEDDKLYTKAKQILSQELEEQVLRDGAHYELTPMYHQIILHRILDCINLVKNNDWNKKELLKLLQQTAELMLSWMEEITFRNGEIPKLNDSSSGIAPTSKELFAYASRLGVEKKEVQLKESGYRKFTTPEFEIRMDVGQIAPIYQPGHSHADSLQFVLNFKNKPIIVDTGISTYEKNERRQLERSTVSHNTVTIEDANSSEVWGGFRVAKRAKVQILRETRTLLEAYHNGYRNLGVTHQRRFLIEENSFRVLDQIKGKIQACKIQGHLHFHPETNITLKSKTLEVNKELQIEFIGVENLDILEYLFAVGFNELIPAKKITYSFQGSAEILIRPLVLDTSASILNENEKTVAD